MSIEEENIVYNRLTTSKIPPITKRINDSIKKDSIISDILKNIIINPGIFLFVNPISTVLSYLMVNNYSVLYRLSKYSFKNVIIP